MSDLTHFLLARIAEDEGVAQAVPAGVVVTGLPSEAVEHLMNFPPARVLAECEAKRQIVKIHAPSTLRPVSNDTIRLLALPYADHPDYRQEWKP